ncbi:MAG: hypothetical protein H6662_19730 [Ardenticatenaceae bacterium]|nr:hypothetical protein [Ardenticatenaceae bacterium]
MALNIPNHTPGTNGLRPEICDHANVLVFDAENRILILEDYGRGSAWGSWRIISCSLAHEEDPLTAVKHTLLAQTGLWAADWIYLGSYVLDDIRQIGISHFFCARNIGSTNSNGSNSSHAHKIKWARGHEIREALLDGRIAIIHHAAAITLSLVMCDRMQFNRHKT